MNQSCKFVGRIGRNPETHVHTNGSPVTTFSMGIPRGNRRPLWIRVSAWGNLSDACKDLCGGATVYVEGYLVGDDEGHPRRWYRSDGWSASFELVARQVTLLPIEKVVSVETMLSLQVEMG